MPQTVVHIWRIRPGREEDYTREHERIPTPLADLFADLGVTEYAIYRHQNTLVSFLTVEDYDQLVALSSGNSALESWEQSMAPLVEYIDVDSTTGWPKPLERVWCLTEQQANPSPDGGRIGH